MFEFLKNAEVTRRPSMAPEGDDNSICAESYTDNNSKLHLMCL